MNYETEIEKEERYIEEAYDRGEISLKEFNDDMRELQRDYRISAEIAADEAYQRELERW